jgi:hypothetical protein
MCFEPMIMKKAERCFLERFKIERENIRILLSLKLEGGEGFLFLDKEQRSLFWAVCTIKREICVTGVQIISREVTGVK